MSSSPEQQTLTTSRVPYGDHEGLLSWDDWPVITPGMVDCGRPSGPAMTTVVGQNPHKPPLNDPVV
jgi:hypothetical protein